MKKREGVKKIIKISKISWPFKTPKWLALALTLFLPTIAQADLPEYPSIGLNDFAKVIHGINRDFLEQKIDKIRQNQSVEVTVVTVPSIDPFIPNATIDNLSQSLFYIWQTDNTKNDKSIMLIYSVEENQARIELGSGFTQNERKALTDLIDGTVKTTFRRQEYVTGIRDILGRISDVLNGGPSNSSTTLKQPIPKNKTQIAQLEIKTGQINDLANVLSGMQESSLNDKIKNIKYVSAADISIITVPSIDGSSASITMDDYLNLLQRHSSPKPKNHILILLNVETNRVQIHLAETYNRSARLLIERIEISEMLVNFRQKQFYLGLSNGLDRIRSEFSSGRLSTKQTKPVSSSPKPPNRALARMPRPIKTGVNDLAATLTSFNEKSINTKIKELRQEWGAEIAIVTIKSFYHYTRKGDSDIFTNALFHKWKVWGDKKQNRILVLLSVENSDVQIKFAPEFKYQTKQHLQKMALKEMSPAFLRSEYGKGFIQGLNSIQDAFVTQKISLPKPISLIDKRKRAFDWQNWLRSIVTNTLVILCIGLLGFFAIGYFGFYKRSRWGLSKTCPSCDGTCRALSPSQGTDYLRPEQELEQHLKSVRHIVLHCQECFGFHVKSFPSFFRKMGQCRKCKSKTVKTIQFRDAGHKTKASNCLYCDETYIS